ncbi:uncharacterized protein LOC143222738 [Tachypleus tridentatus]|uniref:uncharacterized protein LOC143222738 n=1 Tax=Tachypleus tridentatus TaxID=6853 RepID=UPI003FD0A890
MVLEHHEILHAVIEVPNEQRVLVCAVPEPPHCTFLNEICMYITNGYDVWKEKIKWYELEDNLQIPKDEKAWKLFGNILSTSQISKTIPQEDSTVELKLTKGINVYKLKIKILPSESLWEERLSLMIRLASGISEASKCLFKEKHQNSSGSINSQIPILIGHLKNKNESPSKGFVRKEKLSMINPSSKKVKSAHGAKFE